MVHGADSHWILNLSLHNDKNDIVQEADGLPVLLHLLLERAAAAKAAEDADASEWLFDLAMALCQQVWCLTHNGAHRNTKFISKLALLLRLVAIWCYTHQREPQGNVMTYDEIILQQGSTNGALMATLLFLRS